MQRHVLLAEAVVVVRAAEVQLADGIDAVAPGLEPVGPGGDAAVIGDGVVPESDVVHVAAGLEARARGDADWRVAVGVGETHAARRQPIEVGRADHRVSVTAEHTLAVLVRHDEQQISGLHDRSCSLACLIRIVAHGDARADGDREVDGRAGLQGLSRVALHAQECAADVHLVVDDVAEERAFDEPPSKHVAGCPRFRRCRIGLPPDGWRPSQGPWRRSRQRSGEHRSSACRSAPVPCSRCARSGCPAACSPAP